MKRRTVALIAAIASCVLSARHLDAQQADVIRGRVTSVAGDSPIENASITATTLAGGVNRSARTDRNGRYMITFPGGEGDYFITVIAIGYVPRRFEVKRLADQDVLIADTRLTPSSSTLDTVVTLGRRDRPLRGDTLGDIGGMDRIVNTSNVAIEQLGNLAVMAASTPGLIFIPGVDGDPSGYSALGLEAAQNGLTINGMNSIASDLPRDGSYSVAVALSPYDVSQGQFSGGRTNVRIGSGSNYIRRTGSLVLNAPQLEWTDRAGRALGQKYLNANVGGGVSGPISYDKAFYNISYQLGRAANDLQTLLNTDPLGLETIGIARDSVARLVDILGNASVPATVGGFPNSRLSDQGLVLGSFDFAPPSSSSGQAFNVTLNGGWTKSSPASPLTRTLPAASFNTTSWNGAVQGHHTNYYGVGVLSETGVAFSTSRRYTTPYVELPGGNVRVNSIFADGSSVVGGVAFGGAPTSGSVSANSVELTNQLSWFSENNKHRLKLASSVRRDGYSIEQANNHLGTFTFNSLSDLQEGRAASFTRQLSPNRNTSAAIIAGLSLGDSYRPSNDVQIVYGARLDANHFLERPASNPDVGLFGLRNDRVPNAVYVSPRLGFSWTYGRAAEIASFAGAARVPRAVLRGGIGVFQGSPQATLLNGAIVNTGLASGAQQLTCTGAATPVPNWSAYASDPAAVPTQCADGTTGSVFASSVPNVTLFASDYALPRSIRGNLGWSGAVLDNRVMATVNAVYSQNERQPGFVDRNLEPAAQFTLAAESGRPVFVQPTSIVPSTGAVASRDGRVSSQFNHVTELRSDFSSVAKQMQVILAPAGVSTRYTWGLAYTLNSVRERANGYRSSTTANPFDVSTARSQLDWRHQVQANVGYNLFDVVRLNWFQTFVSGLPYTPVVAGDVNGDGYSLNDRAFIFDPARADAAVAAGMNALLTQSSSSVRDCLRRQLGQLAARSSCEAPWTSTANLRIDFNPVRVRMPQRTMLSFSVANALGAADLLFHGANRTHGWGQFALPENQLLLVRGFDQRERKFAYQVNPRFGNTSQAVSAFRNPVALTAVVRIDLGPTRERQDLTRRLDAGRKTPGPKASAAELSGAYSSAGLINPMVVILRAADSLHLSGPQADSVATMNRWYLVRLDSIWSPVVREYTQLPDTYDRGMAYARYCRAREASVDLLIKLAPALNSVLTPAQHRKLPALTAAHLDRRYLVAVRSGTPGLSAPVFPPPAGTPGERGGGRGGR